MKTKFYWVTLLASAALFAQAQAGGHHSGGGGTFTAAGAGPARTGGGPSFHSMPTRSFGGGRMIYSGQPFSSTGLRAPRSMEFRPQYPHSNAGRAIGSRQVVPGNINRGNRSTQFSSAGNRP